MSTNPKQTLPDIHPRSFQHPLDRAAMRALKKVPGLDWVVRKVLTQLGERRLRLYFLGSAVRVEEDQFPRFHALFREACRTLDVRQPPELFVAQHLMVNAFAIGADKPFVVLTSGLYDTMSDEEIQCVMGHELGHILCGHALYTTLLMFIMNNWFLFLGIPGGVYALLALIAALLEWSRKGELTSDRAGLLTVQDPNVAYRVDMKLAGGKAADQMNLDAFLRQADEFEAGGDLLDGILKMSFTLNTTHPFSAMRVKELRKWVLGGDYERILGGTYTRRSETPAEDLADDVKSTAQTYKEAAAASKDPFVRALRDLGGGMAATGASLFDLLKRATKGAGKDADDAEDDDEDTPTKKPAV